MQKDNSSFAYHRKRTKDNLVWIVIILGLLWFASSCTTTRGSGPCQVNRNMIGFGAR